MNKNKTDRIYRAALSRALSISLTHPYLWVLGFLASLGITSGVFEATLSNIFSIIRSENFFDDISQLYQGQIFDLIFSFFERFSLSLEYPLSALVGGFGLIFLLIYITTIAHIALIEKIHKLSKGQVMHIEQTLSNAHNYFPNVLAISLISKLLYAALLIITTAPIVIAVTLNNNDALAFGLSFFVLVFFPLAVLLSILTLYITLYIVLYDQELVEAIRRGWILLTRNFLITIEIMGTLLLVYLGGLLVTLLLASLIFIPLAFFIGAFLIIQQTALFAILLAVGIIITVIAYFSLNGWYNTFYISTTTILFDQLTSREISSKISRLMTSLHRALKLTTTEKNAVKHVTRAPQSSADAVVNIVEQKIQETMPALEQLVEKAYHAYENSSELKKIEADLKKIVKEEKASLLPTLKKVAKTAQYDAKTLNQKVRPQIQKAAKTAQKNLSEKFPHLIKIKEKLKRQYIKEIEQELSRVFVEESELSKISTPQQTSQKRGTNKASQAQPRKKRTRRTSSSRSTTRRKRSSSIKK